MTSLSITFLSDLHGYKPELGNDGDLLIIAGDLTANDTYQQYIDFAQWLMGQSFFKKIIIGGNHDNLLQKTDIVDDILYPFTYLQDSGTEYEGIKIWGSPWSKKFHGQNPTAMAFALDTDIQLMEKWENIPTSTDILITHSPPYGILDRTWNHRRCGCHELLKAVNKINPRIHCFGHLHASHGTKVVNDTIFINASHVDDDYKPVYEPIRIVYDKAESRGLGKDCCAS